MNAKERRKIENQLMVMGLGKLDEPGFLDVFASMVDGFPGDKHWLLQGMINECEPQRRTEMYESLRPRFRSFKPLSLATYEMRIAEEAGKMVSQRRMRVEGSRPRPIEIKGKKLRIARTRAEANCGWAILECHTCRKREKFLGDTPVDALTKARAKGWVRNVTLEWETCPKCQAKVDTMPRVVMAEGNA